MILLSLLFVCLCLVTFIGSKVPLQFDFTHDKIYTLSEGSKKIIEQVNQPIVLKFFYSSSADDLPIWLKNYANRVQSILNQYEKHSDGNLELIVINPKPDTPEQEEAIRLGVRGQELPNGEEFFFGLVALQADQINTLEIFAPEREEFLEYDISKTIYDVQESNKPVLGLLTSLPIIGTAEGPTTPAKNWAIGDELKRSYSIQTITQDSIPPEVEILAVIHPPAMTPQLQFAIDQFLLTGKPVLLAIDPSSFYQRTLPNKARTSINQGQVLKGLLGKWGILYNPQKIVGDFRLGYPLPIGRGGAAESYPIWMNFQEFASDTPATAQLENILFLEAGSFQLHRKEGLRLSPWLQSTQNSGEMLVSSLYFTSPESIPNQINVDKKIRTIAGMITGKFETAFPDGEPPIEGSLEEEFADIIPDYHKTPYLYKSATESRLVLLCDTDFLVDEYSVQRGDFLGVQVTRPLNDNLLLISNALDMLSGSKNLISIRGKGNTLRTFTRIDNIRVAAENEYRAELEEVEKRVNEIQKSIQQLEAPSERGNALVLSDETLAAIEKLKKEEATARAERRRIRKELREEIENLGIALATLNLVPVPLALLFVGTIFFYRRNRK